jgi:hypothetical protein
MIDTDMPILDLRKKLASIDQMLADHDRLPSFNLREKLARFDRALADHDRQRREIAYAPWLVMIAGAGIGAALFAAGMAFGTKIFGS